MCPKRWPLTNFTLTDAADTMVPMLERCRIATLRLVICHRPSIGLSRW